MERIAKQQMGGAGRKKKREQDSVYTKPKGMQGMKGERMKEIKRGEKKNEEWRSKQRGRRGLARRLGLWLPLLSVCTEMSAHCDILPYSFPCCLATTV